MASKCETLGWGENSETGPNLIVHDVVDSVENNSTSKAANELTFISRKEEPSMETKMDMKVSKTVKYLEKNMLDGHNKSKTGKDFDHLKLNFVFQGTEHQVADGRRAGQGDQGDAVGGGGESYATGERDHGQGGGRDVGVERGQGDDHDHGCDQVWGEGDVVRKDLPQPVEAQEVDGGGVRDDGGGELLHLADRVRVQAGRRQLCTTVPLDQDLTMNILREKAASVGVVTGETESKRNYSPGAQQIYSIGSAFITLVHSKFTQ